MSQALVDEGNSNAVVGYSVGDFFDSASYPEGTINLYTVLSEDSGTALSDPLEAYNINTGDKTCDIRNIPSPNYFKLTLTDMSDVALPDTDPIDGIPEISADGVTTCKLLIEKYSGSDNPLTGASHTNTLSVWATHAGGIDNYTPTLVAGVATVVITAPSSLDVSDITVTDTSVEGLAKATTQLQFK